MKMMKGFTLIEILVALAILVSLTAIAVPSFAELTVKVRVDNEISHLYRMLLTARNAAVNTGIKTTVCPLVNNVCSDNWALSVYVFSDQNNNKVFEKHLNEEILLTKDAIQQSDKLQYGKNRTAVTYTPSGHLSGWGQNGTFKYCPFNHAALSRGLIVATSGRVYKSFQRKSGKETNRSGKVIRCI